MKVKTSIMLDITVFETIKKLAAKEDRSVSRFINKILKEYLNQKNSPA